MSDSTSRDALILTAHEKALEAKLWSIAQDVSLRFNGKPIDVCSAEELSRVACVMRLVTEGIAMDAANTDGTDSVEQLENAIDRQSRQRMVTNG